MSSAARAWRVVFPASPPVKEPELAPAAGHAHLRCTTCGALVALCRLPDISETQASFLFALLRFPVPDHPLAQLVPTLAAELHVRCLLCSRDIK